LLEGAVDYAGLFPPAGLSMSEAVTNYAGYRSGDHSWMLGRFVLSVAQLDEFIESADDLISDEAHGAWRLSALAGEDLTDSVRRVRNFNTKFAPRVLIDSIEVKAASTSKIENTVNAVPPEIHTYFELALDEKFPDLLATVALKGKRAKIRTGGVTPDAFPKTRDIIRFVRTCLAANVPFKATAGLHHPVRCFKPLTYEPDAPMGTMHGFLNLFLMSGYAREGYRQNLLEEIMEDEFEEVFKFDESGATWRDQYRLSLFQIESLRATGIQSFGSCSFTEPVADLQKLGIL
jgi:hypothetical protein